MPSTLGAGRYGKPLSHFTILLTERRLYVSQLCVEKMYYEEKEDREGGRGVPGMRLVLWFQTEWSGKRSWRR